MKTRFNSLVKIVATLSLASITFTQAADQYWNPSPLSDNWANSVWSATSGGGSLSTWTTENNAIFDQAGTYTATINAAQTATNLDIKAGTVTFAGTNTVSATAITIDSGAILSGAGDRYLKVGTTALTVNGTLDYTALTLTTRRVSITGGNGSIILGAGLRIGGAITFAGDISGSAGALVTDAGGIIDLSGNNTYGGDTLIRSGNTLRLGSATALSSNSMLRIGGGSTIELTGTNFSRTLALTGAGNMRIGNTGDASANTFGFAAVNADRTVALNGTVQWATPGNVTFAPSIFNLGTAASTHKVTLTTGINLNVGTRTINTDNGTATVEAEISGVLSGAAGSNLTKTGAGVLLLSNGNTYIGTTTISGGVLGLGNGGTTGALAATGTIVNNANLTINRSNAVVQGTDFSSAAITGSGSFTQAGAGTTTFTVANSYVGATDVQNGTLQLNATLAATTMLNLGNGSNSGKVILGNAAALAQTVAGLTSTGTGTTNAIVGSAIANSTLTVSLASGSNSYAGVLGGAGINENSLALTKSGGGTLILSGTNTYTGVTTISAGTISVAVLGNGGASGNLGAAPVAASNLVFGGGTLQISAAGPASSNRAFTINATSSATFNVSDATGALTLSGSIPTTTGVLFKTGVGSLTLDPGAVSQSLGAISANGGELILKSGTYATTAKDAAVSAYNVGAGARGGTLTIDGATLNIGGTGINLKIAANGNGNLNIKSGTVTSSDIAIGHNGIGVATQSGGTVTTANLYHQDAGVGSNYTLTGGSLTAKRIYNSPSATSGTFTLNLNGGTLKSAAGTNNLIDNQGGSSEITVLLGAGNTIIDTTASNASIVRPMGNMPSVAGAFTKAGGNTLTLTAENTYSGGTTVAAGTLHVNNTTGSGTGAGAVNVTGTPLGSIVATLGGTGNISGAVTVSALGTLSPTAQTSGSKLSLGSTLDFTSGSIFNWDLSADASDPVTKTQQGNYGQVAVSGAASGTAVFNIALLGGVGKTSNYADAFWDTDKTWNNLFASAGMTDLSTLFTSFTGTGLTSSGSGSTAIATAGDRGHFSFNSSSTLTWTAVPEPSTALAGILLGFGLLRRRR